MPSAAAKKKADRKKALDKERMAKKLGKKEGEEEQVEAVAVEKVCPVGKITENVKELNARSTAGVLSSPALGADIHIHNFTMSFHGNVLCQDTNFELNYGNRYGLLGANGCGKTTLLKALAEQDIPLQKHIDIFYLSREMEASDKTPIECVQEVDEERTRLEEEVEWMMTEDPENPRLNQIYERLDELDVDKAEAKAARILTGLGFTATMQKKKLSDFSGGWRMRVSLARALFLKPYLMLLDEPTNHLDLNACVWLEQELKTYKSILVLISHSQDFLNNVCTNIIYMQQSRIMQFSGNYDTFEQTLNEQQENQMKKYSKEQVDIAKMKEYVARFGHGSRKLAKQGKSKEKLLNKRLAEGLTEAVYREKTVSFKFPEVSSLPSPVMMVQGVSFRYNESTPWIYDNLEFGMDLDTRVALVGPNGAGKSTLLKLISGELMPTDGMIRRHSHLKIARYHQHLADQLDLEATPLEYMMAQYPEMKDIENTRKIVGRYGITGKQQTTPIGCLSDGQRCRVALAWLSYQKGHFLLLDEPTNHLDIETIDALADAIKGFNGGMVLVSHDFRLINQVADEIWECRDGDIHKWTGDIIGYKHHLVANMGNESVNMAQSADNRVRARKAAAPAPKPVAVAAPKPTTSIKIGFAPPAKTAAPAATNGKSNGGYVPPHQRKQQVKAEESEDWFGDE